MWWCTPVGEDAALRELAGGMLDSDLDPFVKKELGVPVGRQGVAVFELASGWKERDEKLAQRWLSSNRDVAHVRRRSRTTRTPPHCSPNPLGRPILLRPPLPHRRRRNTPTWPVKDRELSGSSSKPSSLLVSTTQYPCSNIFPDKRMLPSIYIDPSTPSAARSGWNCPPHALTVLPLPFGQAPDLLLRR